MYIYNYVDHLGNVRLSYYKNPTGSAEALEENNYYPFGLKHSGYNNIREANPSYQYKYNGKELQESGMYDYGARFYMPDIGRWGVSDGKGELYLSKSPYSYANNTPINAIDPDGNVVIFINGMHFDHSGGKPQYWRIYENQRYYERTPFGNIPTWREEETIAFDRMVMDQLNDHNAIYKDGAIGGANTPYTFGGSIMSKGRIGAGYQQGKKDAETIIANLAKDATTGEITETIKIVTHSMGGAYGKGYVKALKEYISTLPKEQQRQVKITLVADFDPFQAGSLKADKDIFTQQFTHTGGLADQKQEGVDDYHEKEGDHSIFTFLGDISKLQEGTYKWNGSSWECVTCKK